MADDRRERELAAKLRAPKAGAAKTAAPVTRPLFRADEERIPIVEEQVEVGKREVETGRLRVHTVVDEEKLNLTELLERDVEAIKRVPVAREVAQDHAGILGDHRLLGAFGHFDGALLERKDVGSHVGQIDYTVRRTDVEVERLSDTDRTSGERGAMFRDEDRNDCR